MTTAKSECKYYAEADVVNNVIVNKKEHYTCNEKENFIIRFITEEKFGWRVAEYCPEAIRILDTEDLHFLRKARQEALKNNTAALNDYLFSETTIREIASIYRCDSSLII